MSKKKLDVTAIKNELEGASAFFQRPADTLVPPPSSDIPEETPGEEQNSAQDVAQKSTQDNAQMRRSIGTKAIEDLNEHADEPSRPLPSTDEIEEFSFKLRNEHSVQVQALLPEAWKRELEDMAYRLRVGKLELYRFIFGEFLKKVKRKKAT
jgi:hypothetical protein